MTEQEKQIEEMAKIICCMPKVVDCKKCIEQDGFHKCSAIRAGRELSGAGYRKIPDGAVVMTKYEYERLKNKSMLIADIGLCDELKKKIDEEMERFEKSVEIEVDKIRKETAMEILLYLLDGLKKQRARYSQEYDKWDAAQKDCDREDWKSDYTEKREKANGYYLMADRAIGYIKKLAKEYGIEVDE